jgi:hypothetical protein
MGAPHQKGAHLATPYETETNLEKVLSDLALAPISSEERRNIRSELGEIIGRALAHMEQSKKHNPKGRIQKRDVIGSLKAIADAFQTAEPLLRGLETGFRDSHQIAVTIQVRDALGTISEIKNADRYLRDFCDRMDTVLQACVIATAYLRSTKGNAGRKAVDWYDEFARLVASIARKNKIRTAIAIDRITHKPKGQFLDLAAAFEQLLYPTMRSPSRVALAKRLTRSLGRIK